MRLPEITQRSSRVAVVAVLIAQTAIFFFFLRNGPAVVSDNIVYEQGGWAIASGRGLALPYDIAPDPAVRSWACARHPDACTDGAYPTAQYPPGYQLFIAAIYSVTGRQLWPLVIVQLVMLCAMFVCIERLAARYLAKPGYWFTIAAAATYPYLARQAGLIMSDHVHAALLTFSLTALYLMKPGWKRGVLFGMLFGAAALTRSYSVVIIPFLFGWPRLRRAFGASRKEWLLSFGVCVLPFVIWTARNAYWFGRFVPVSTTGLGCHVYLNKVEAEVGSPYEAGNAKKIVEAYSAGGDPASYEWNRTMMKEGVAWIRENPGAMGLAVVERIPQLWISRGEFGKGLSRATPVLRLHLGTLLLLGVVGIWLKRRDGRWNAMALIIMLYWGFLLTTPAEARRTLPLRLPMLMFAGLTVDAVAKRWSERRLQKSKAGKANGGADAEIDAAA